MSSSIVTLSIFFLAMELIAFAAGYLYLEGRKLKNRQPRHPIISMKRVGQDPETNWLGNLSSARERGGLNGRG